VELAGKIDDVRTMFESLTTRFGPALDELEKRLSPGKNRVAAFGGRRRSPTPL